MELITKKNITVEKLQGLFTSAVWRRNYDVSPLFHLATKECIVTVKLETLSNGGYVVKSAPHSSYYINMPRCRSTYLHGTYEELVGFIKKGDYDVRCIRSGV